MRALLVIISAVSLFSLGKKFAATGSEYETLPWRPCSEISRELRILCRCMVKQEPTTSIYMNCDRVVFVGGDITPLPYGAPIVSLRQRRAGRQVLPTRALTSSGLPLAIVDFSENSIRRLTERLLFSIRSTLTELRLADNLLGDSLNPIFSTTELHGLTLLKILDLSGNQIKGIEEGMFKGCENLQELYFDRNILIQIPSESLNGPKALKILSLTHNRIDIIRSGAFRAQQTMEMIDISNNRISTIENGAFSGMRQLRDLKLKHNLFTKFNSDIFEGASNLNNLDLSHNFISDFPTVALKMLTNLKHLNLSANLIKSLNNNNLVSLEKLESLAISRNNIANVAPGTFLGLRNLKHLDISVNSLRAIEDDAFEGLEYLSSLILRDNNILVIPASALGRLPNLISLQLEYNRIAAISSEILRSITVQTKELVLSQNVIRELPAASFQHFKHITKLDLSRNLISTLNSDAYIGLENTLIKLYLSQNRISSIVGSPLSLSKLEYLDISDNRISELPVDYFHMLPALTYLNISKNLHLYSLAAGILHHVPLLKIFDVSNSNLKSIPINLFANSKRLQYIYLHGNALTDIAEGTFVNLNNLTVVDLANNRIVNIRPSSFVNVMNVRELSLRGNSLNTFKGEFFNTGTSLEILDLSDNQISYIFPSSFRIHPRLRKIIVSGNKFNFFPAELIASLQYLEYIDLCRNGLKIIDELDFARLPRLRTLLLAANQLESISEMAFHNSTQLQVLDLSYNQIERLADRTFEGLARMEMLNLEGNSLSELPDTIFDRTKLQMLENIILSRNAFEIAPLKSLQRQYFFLSSVDLSHNNLKEIPQDTSIMVNIKELDLSYNPLSEGSIANILSEPKTVRDLNLAATGIQELVQLETPFLIRLNLSNNNISKLTSKMLERSTLLEDLDLSNNLLNQIETNVWGTLKNLQNLNISGNPIESIVRGDLEGLEMLSSLQINSLEECTRIEKNAFGSLKNLAALDAFNYPKLGYLDVQGVLRSLPFLSRVNIEVKDSAIGNDQLGSILHPQLEMLGVYGPRLHSISSGILSGLKTPEIQIQIRNTSLTSLPPTFFFSMPRSTKIILDVTGSRLTSLSPQLLVALDDRRNDLQLIGLDSNPIVCDCGVRALRRWLPIHMQRIKCKSPQHLAGKLLIEVGDDELVCDSRVQSHTSSSSTTLAKTKYSTQYPTTEPQIIWSVASTTTKKRASVSPTAMNNQPGVSNDDTLIIGIVGGVVAFILMLVILICIIRLRMSNSTQYRGGPMANGAPPIGNSSCACSIVKPVGSHSVYSAPPMYAATLPHRPMSAAAAPARPMYATLGSRSSPYMPQLPHPYLMVMPPTEEKMMYR